MTVRPYVAGVDTSTQSCKVLIVDPDSGAVIREGRASHPDGTEVHPDHWWNAFLEAVEQAGGLDDVHALSVAGQQHGLVLLDEEGQVIRETLLWNDTRSADAAERLILDLGDGDRNKGALLWLDRVGSLPVASLTASKIRWVAEEEPENAKRIAAICLPHDWLTWRISGSQDIRDLMTDRSDASGTGYMSRLIAEYDYDLLALALDTDEELARKVLLPRILDPWEVAAQGDPERGWGEIVLGPGCGDNAGASLGLDLKPGEASLSLGTSGVVAVISDHSVTDPTGLVNGFADATGNWLPLACTLNASRIIDAMASIIDANYEEFDELALSVPDTAGLTLVPYFEGERTPNLPNATATLEGMTLANADRAHVARATVEGLLGLMRYALDSVRELGVEIETVYLIGGGAKSAAVQALAPGMLDADVVVAEPAEYVALGAAKQAARLKA